MKSIWARLRMKQWIREIDERPPLRLYRIGSPGIGRSRLDEQTVTTAHVSTTTQILGVSG